MNPQLVLPDASPIRKKCIFRASSTATMVLALQTLGALTIGFLDGPPFRSEVREFVVWVFSPLVSLLCSSSTNLQHQVLVKRQISQTGTKDIMTA